MIYFSDHFQCGKVAFILSCFRCLTFPSSLLQTHYSLSNHCLFFSFQLDTFTAVYKKLTGKDVNFEFPE